MSDTFNVSFPVKAADVGAVIAALSAMNIAPDIKHVPAVAPAHSVRLPAQSRPQTVTATQGPATPSTSSRSGAAVRCLARTKKGEPCRAWACEDAKNIGVTLCKVHYVEYGKTA